MSHSPALAPSATSRVLGAAGILGGTVLLGAFLLEIPAGANTLRLLLFNLGAIAIVVAVQRRQASAGSRLASVVAAAAIFANAWYLAMVLLSVGRPMPPEPDPAFRLVMFYAGLAMWLADSAFGFVTLRLESLSPSPGRLARVGALALAIGSLLAILGMSHLELTSPANPTIFGPISLIGVALNGVAWILLGLDVMLSGADVRGPLSVPAR
jgi:hypothetical protein